MNESTASASDTPQDSQAGAGSPAASGEALDPKLLEMLVCPLTRSPLRQEGDELVAEVGGLRYPIRDGIAVLLADQAKLPEGVASLDAFRQKYAQHIPDVAPPHPHDPTD